MIRASPVKSAQRQEQDPGKKQQCPASDQASCWGSKLAKGGRSDRRW